MKSKFILFIMMAFVFGVTFSTAEARKPRNNAYYFCTSKGWFPAKGGEPYQYAITGCRGADRKLKVKEVFGWADGICDGIGLDKRTNYFTNLISLMNAEVFGSLQSCMDAHKKEVGIITKKFKNKKGVLVDRVKTLSKFYYGTRGKKEKLTSFQLRAIPVMVYKDR